MVALYERIFLELVVFCGLRIVSSVFLPWSVVIDFVFVIGLIEVLACLFLSFICSGIIAILII